MAAARIPAIIIALGLFAVYLALPLADGASAGVLRWLKPQLSPRPYSFLTDWIFHLVVADALIISLTAWRTAVFFWPRPRRVVSGRGRIAGISAAVVFAILASTETAFFFDATFPLGRGGHRGIFLHRCGTCHSPERPLDFIQSAEGWRAVVARMRDKPGATIDAAAGEDIYQYLMAVRGITTAALINARCGKCHEPFREKSIKRPPAEIAEIIGRLRSLDSRFCSRPEAAAMARRLAYADPSSLADDEKAIIDFSRTCEACHFLDMLARPLKHGTWAEVVARMQRKAPDLIAGDLAPLLIQRAQEETADLRRFRQRYPHSFVRNPWGAK